MTGWILLAVAALLLVGFVSATLSIALPNPFRVFKKYGSPRGLDPEAVEIARGVPGWYFPHAGSSEVVLVCHGRSRGKAFMLPLVERLARERGVLAFDFPGHGETRYRWSTIGWREADVVRDALEYLSARGIRHVLVYGVSQGGAAAIRALARETPPHVRGLAVDGVFADLAELLQANGRRFLAPAWLTGAAITAAGRIAGYEPRRFRPESDIARVDRPILVLHGDRDPLVPPDSARRLAAAARDARLVLYPGRHDEPTNPHVHEALTRFFASLPGRDRDGARPSPVPEPPAG